MANKTLVTNLVFLVLLIKTNLDSTKIFYKCLDFEGELSDMEFFDENELGILIKEDDGMT
jgi:hypothetical protein